MKPHPRIRRTMKWTGAVVTVLLVIVWVGSGWWGVSVVAPPISVNVLDGALVIGWPTGHEFDFNGFLATDPFIWWGGLGTVTLLGVSVNLLTIPIWLLA